jgi:hypothetical protein
MEGWSWTCLGLIVFPSRAAFLDQETERLREGRKSSMTRYVVSSEMTESVWQVIVPVGMISAVTSLFAVNTTLENLWFETYLARISWTSSEAPWSGICSAGNATAILRN